MISTLSGAVPPGRCSRIASTLPDEQDPDVELGHGVERARDDLARRVVAAHRVDRDGEWRALLTRVASYSTSMT